MEIKIVGRIVGAEDRTTNRESFWAEVRKRVDGPPAEAFAERSEEAIVRELPDRLKDQIQNYISAHGLARRRRITAYVPGIYRRSVIDDYDFVITVKSIRYGSLEVLLDFIAGRNFPLSVADVVQIVSIYAPPA